MLPNRAAGCLMKIDSQFAKIAVNHERSNEPMRHPRHQNKKRRERKNSPRGVSSIFVASFDTDWMEFLAFG